MTGPSPVRLPTGTVTFLFTDIEGSTPLWDADPVAMRDALARHDEIVRKSIDVAGGHVFSTGGDGFAAAFATARDAVVAAVEAQRALSTEPWPQQAVLRVRMGVHTGEANERNGDYFGPPVNRAARLMGAAHGGQVVTSALTVELMGQDDRVLLVDLGSVKLKGLVEPVHAFGATAHDVAWVDRPLVSIQTSAGNLPHPQTEFVGDLADLQRRVSTLGQARLVTLTGSGGVGKTRAAIEIGWLVLDEFADGVWLIDLAPIDDPDAVVVAAAATLKVQPQAGVSVIDSIVDWCFGRRVLLIVDNCEHVLEPVVDLVSAIVARCGTVTIIATSREPLGVNGERVIRIASLEQHHGVELFCARAEAADSGFVASVDDGGAIAAICDRLDGIPLAIELAAARSRSLGPGELLQRLDDRFRVLRGAGRGGLERHQTLRGAVTWSYQLLSPRHRLLFDRLSVFAGGFTIDAAEAVCSGDGIEADGMVDLVGELVDKSMLLTERSGSTTRYRLLETLRQYGADRLEEQGETTAVRDRHLAYYRDVAYGIDDVWWSPAQLDADAICDREWDNFRAAHQWAITTSAFSVAVDIVNGTSSYQASRLRFEGSAWTWRTVELGERLHLSDGVIYAAAAYWAWFAGDPDRAVEFAERGLAISDDEKSISVNQMMRVYGIRSTATFDDAALEAELRVRLSNTKRLSNRFMLTQVLIYLSTKKNDDVEDLLAITREMGAPYPLAFAQLAFGNLLYFRDPPDLEGAIDAYRDAIGLASAAQADLVQLWARASLAFALVMDERDEAEQALRDAIGRSAVAGYVPAIIDGLESCAVHLSNVGQRESAATLLGYLQIRPNHSRAAEGTRARIGRDVAGLVNLDTLQAHGAAMNQNEVVAYALAHLAET